MKDLVMTNGVGASELADFLWYEADLLDTKDYHTWLDLWAEGGHYVIPVDKEGDDFANMLNIAYDDAEMRKARVERLLGGFSISSAPPAETVRTVSRFRVTERGEDSVTVTAGQHIIEDKFGRQRVFAANVTWVLDTSDGLKIRDKVVRLLNSDGMLTSISYLM